MRTVRDIIDLWPRQSLIARDLDVPASTVTNWKARGSIPPIYWKGLLLSAKRHGVDGVTAEALVDAHAPPPGTAPPGFGEEAQAPLEGTPTPRHGDIRSYARPFPGETRKQFFARLSAEGPPPPAMPGKGHFSRYYHLRRSNFPTMEAINDHVAALREEWDR